MTSQYNIIQSNGQRIYQPSSSAPTPPKGSEVFVGNLPRDLFEDDLIPIFEQVGPIFKLRLMMDFSGSTRGFSFVHYHTIEDAANAVLRFDKCFISSQTRTSQMTVHISVDNCRLYFGNVPKEKSGEEIQEDLAEILDGVAKVIVFPEPNDPSNNRGFAFVEFETHAQAAIARRKLLSGIIRIWKNKMGKYEKLYVDWAEPEPMVNPWVLTQVKILYFKNIPIGWSNDRFKEFTSKLLTNIQILRIYKKDSYAFVHFYDRFTAETALRILKNMSEFLVICGKQIEVEWARPCNYSKKYRVNNLPDNYCTSVPPRLRRLVHQSKKITMSSLSKNPSRTSSKSDDSADIEQYYGDSSLTLQLEKLTLSCLDF